MYWFFLLTFDCDLRLSLSDCEIIGDESAATSLRNQAQGS